MLTHQSREEDFPTLRGRVYLNTAAEGIPPLGVKEAFEAYYADKLRGMSGRDAHFDTENKTKALFAKLFGLEANEIAFCSSSAEAGNLLRTAVKLKPNEEVIINDLDFPSGITPWIGENTRTRLWESDHGELKLERLMALLKPETRLVQTSLISFYNGFRLAWEPFVQMVRRYAPSALIVVDVTQAAGRVPLALSGADMIFSSTHKWLLGSHGGCAVGIPASSAAKVTANAGGWYNLENAFASNRFQDRQSRQGAASFATGMPNFPMIYALNASLTYLLNVGIEPIAQKANHLTETLSKGLEGMGVKLMCPYNPAVPSGILAFQHANADALHQMLHSKDIHVMNHAGRIRLSVHGYNTMEDIEHALSSLRGMV